MKLTTHTVLGIHYHYPPSPILISSFVLEYASLRLTRTSELAGGNMLLYAKKKDLAA